MRLHLSVLLVVATGCVVEEPGLGETEFAVKKCPDDTCTVGNSNGVYTDENGSASMGPNQFMIAHFINTPTQVTLVGRYLYDAPTGPDFWVQGTGYVSGADFQGEWFAVDSIDESFTVPIFTLSRSPTVPPFQVTGSQLVTGPLILHVSIDDGTHDYDLSWNSYSSEPGNNVVVRKANMRWRNQKLGLGWTQYCLNEDGSNDPVVFQKGIGVHPVTADLIYNASFVTVGCRHGGMATVRLWGYSYQAGTASADLFRAGLHMKRASYCGDKAFYTHSGTQIWIWDSSGINAGAVTPGMEASWGPNGATCVNLNFVRHGDVDYPLGSGNYFDGHCPTYTLPPCGSGPGTLASKAQTPIPAP